MLLDRRRHLNISGDDSAMCVFQDDKDLVHQFVSADGLTCLIQVGAEADQNYQNYILRGKPASDLSQVGQFADCLHTLLFQIKREMKIEQIQHFLFHFYSYNAAIYLFVQIRWSQTNAVKYLHVLMFWFPPINPTHSLSCAKQHRSSKSVFFNVFVQLYWR